MELKVTYVARYESTIYDCALQPLQTNNFILCVFDDIMEAQRYAKQYFNDDCSKYASFQSKIGKLGGLFIKVEDKILDRVKRTTEVRCVIIEACRLNRGNTAVEDIQNRMK